MTKNGETLGVPKNISVLIVEDDKFLRELIAEKLEKEQYQVLTAVDGKEGLERMRAEKPSIVLLDLVIPETDGFEFLRIISEDKDVGTTPIIVLSNLGSKEDIERARSLGAKEFLVKANYTPSEIIGEIKRIISEEYL